MIFSYRICKPRRVGKELYFGEQIRSGTVEASSEEEARTLAFALAPEGQKVLVQLTRILSWIEEV